MREAERKRKWRPERRNKAMAASSEVGEYGVLRVHLTRPRDVQFCLTDPPRPIGQRMRNFDYSTFVFSFFLFNCFG